MPCVFRRIIPLTFHRTTAYPAPQTIRAAELAATLIQSPGPRPRILCEGDALRVAGLSAFDARGEIVEL
jgi:hypothetical protein